MLITTIAKVYITPPLRITQFRQKVTSFTHLFKPLPVWDYSLFINKRIDDLGLLYS